MIGSVGSQNQMYAMQQAYQAQATAYTATQPFEADTDDTDSSSSVAGSAASSSSSSAAGPSANPLSSSMLASLLGLQMVNGQTDGGASGAQLGLPQATQPSSMDPNSFLSAQTLQMLQSIGA